jgi:hypothetical protein
VRQKSIGKRENKKQADLRKSLRLSLAWLRYLVSFINLKIPILKLSALGFYVLFNFLS